MLLEQMAHNNYPDFLVKITWNIYNCKHVEDFFHNILARYRGLPWIFPSGKILLLASPRSSTLGGMGCLHRCGSLMSLSPLTGHSVHPVSQLYLHHLSTPREHRVGATVASC